MNVSNPRAGITVYSMVPKDTKDGEERASGPFAIGIATDGRCGSRFHRRPRSVR